VGGDYIYLTLPWREGISGYLAAPLRGDSFLYLRALFMKVGNLLTLLINIKEKDIFWILHGQLLID
jgi:hypothetical protein